MVNNIFGKSDFLPQIVPLGRRNEFLKTAPKKVSRKPKTFQSMSENEENVGDFQMNVVSRKCFT